MPTLGWIVASGLAMSAPLLGGALFHMLPEAVDELGNELAVYAWLVAGFYSFFLVEQFLHWHHCHRPVAAPCSTTSCPGLTFLVGSLVAYALSGSIDVAVLVPFAAGNFVYIAATDLLPEITTSPNAKEKSVLSVGFAAGLLFLFVIAVMA